MSSRNAAGDERSALVTGATGFVGSHLTRRLIADGWNTHAIVRRGSKLERLAGATAHQHDGTTETMLRIVEKARPDVVFHLAAAGGSSHSPADIKPLLESNVVFGSQLLEAMAAGGARQLINTGTYWQHFNDAEYDPVSFYAACKEAFEKILRFYVETSGLEAITLVLFDTYGGDDPRPRLFNQLRQAARSGQALAMSPGDQLIDIVHVDDVVEAYVVAARLLGQHGAGRFAVSSGSPIQLRQLVDIYADVTGASVHVRWGERSYRPREVMKPWSAGKPLPGWAPRISLRDGLGRLN